LFDRIREGALARELDRRLPVEEIADLKQAGFGALRVPPQHGGAGLTLPEFFALLIELSEADSNITQSLRAHFGFVEDALSAADPERSVRWLERVGRGALVGGAWSEVGEAKQAAFSTKVSGPPNALRLDGRKYYSTGALFSDWVDVGATDEAGEGVNVTILRSAPGVEILDDWDGIGQALTASGTAIFHGVAVEPGEVRKAKGRFAWSPAFFQLVHLATLAGIGRALAGELAAAVARRDRSYSHATADRPARDPQVLQVVGRVRSLAYATGPIVLAAAAALERATQSTDDPDALAAAIATSEIETAQAQIAERSPSTRLAPRQCDAHSASIATGATRARSLRTIPASTKNESSEITRSTALRRRRNGASANRSSACPAGARVDFADPRRQIHDLTSTRKACCARS